MSLYHADEKYRFGKTRIGFTDEERAMKKYTILLLTITLAIIISAVFRCNSANRADFAVAGDAQKSDMLVLWTLSDIQPKNASQRYHLESAIEDVNKRIPLTKIAVVAGDIVHYPDSEADFKWYLKARKKSLVPHWYEISGNHDMKDKKNYLKYITEDLHYSVEIGNVLILFMSDEDRHPPQKISDQTFRWWEKQVSQNQDKIIITVTHAYLEQSRLFAYIIPSRNITDSKRFAEVLKKHRVDIWICGHTHIPSYMRGKWRIVPELGGTLFINVSAIRKSFINDIESYFIFLRNGLDHALIRLRNHERGDFVPPHDIIFKLGRPFTWDGSDPVKKAGRL